jgi:Ca2+-binding RTX toxin-like protein
MVGGEGNDTLLGGFWADYIVTGAGNDLATGGSGDDVLINDSGSDTLRGGSGNDRLTSDSPQADVLDGGSGDDRLRSITLIGLDSLIGGLGADVFVITPGREDRIRDLGHMDRVEIVS